MCQKSSSFPIAGGVRTEIDDSTFEKIQGFLQAKPKSHSRVRMRKQIPMRKSHKKAVLTMRKIRPKTHVCYCFYTLSSFS